MSQIYANFEALVQSHDALFRPHRATGALNVCRGVWEAREPEVQSLKEQLAALKTQFDQLNKKYEIACREKQEIMQEKAVISRKADEHAQSLQRILDEQSSQINDLQARNEILERDISRLQKYEDSLDAVQRSQYSEIESLKKRLAAEGTLRSELEVALKNLRHDLEREQLSILTKDDLITRLQARIEDLESRMKQQQRLNTRMGAELDRFARENEQLTRAINQ